MKETMLTVLKYIKLSGLKKAIVLLLILIGKTAYTQDIVIIESRVIHNGLREYKMNIPMMAEVESENELYKKTPNRSYEQKAKTSLIVGLSLLPPAVLFSKLAEPKYPDKYKIGWGAAAFAAASTAMFYLIRYAILKKKAKKTSR